METAIQVLAWDTYKESGSKLFRPTISTHILPLLY